MHFFPLNHANYDPNYWRFSAKNHQNPSKTLFLFIISEIFTNFRFSRHSKVNGKSNLLTCRRSENLYNWSMCQISFHNAFECIMKCKSFSTLNSIKSRESIANVCHADFRLLSGKGCHRYSFNYSCKHAAAG